ncbi:MAG: DUF885 domain-containing protein [Planctomycetes bacterium]|nr:DUF885 domain-containing protein [Planctomycetota bacterium]
MRPRLLPLLFLLLAPLAARAESASEKLQAALRRFFDRGWHATGTLRAPEARDAADWLAETSEIQPEALPPEDRVDLALAVHRVRGLLEAHAARGGASRSAAVWLPRGEALAGAVGSGRPETIRPALEEAAEALAEARGRLTEMKREDAGEGLARADRLKKQLAGARAALKKKSPEAFEACAAEFTAFDAALAKLRGWLSKRRAEAPALTDADRRQRKWTEYLLRARWELGIDDLPMDILLLGEEEFRRTERALERTAARVDPERSWQEIARDLREDHPAADDLLAACRADMESAMKFAIEKGFVTVPEWARHVEARWGDPNGNTPYGYYSPLNPADPELRGAYIVTPVSRLQAAEQAEVLRGNNRAWIRVVALHEAIPGHHLQFAIAARRDREIRKHFYNPSYVEGWGLYCEELMHRHGYYDDRTRLSQLKMRLWRCARAVIDVGCHFGGMTREEAIRLLTDRVGMERPSAAMEVDRYLASPGYYSGYLIGLTRIEGLRRTVEDAQGPEFDERAFHDRLLGYGPLPFRILEEAMGAGTERGK